MKRVVSFIASVVPVSAAQLGMLFGAFCLLIAPNLRWAPVDFHPSYTGSFDPRPIVALGLWSIYLSGCLGLLACFRPGAHPVRRLMVWVCLPAIVGLVLMSGFYISSSIIALTSTVRAQFANSPLVILCSLGPGFHYALLGMLLVIAFIALLGFGFQSLPLALSESSISADLGQSSSWHRVEIFLWAILALFPLIRWTLPITNLAYYFIRSHGRTSTDIEADVAQLVFVDLIMILFAILVIGTDAWRDVRCSLRWPSAYGFALATAFPMGIAALICAGEFLVSWAASRSSELWWRYMKNYLNTPTISLLLLLPVALCEEIIFRGILQPQFIRRYGIARGIFLLGLGFGAAHFSEDFSVGATDALVVAKLGIRLISALALSFVAGWLTLHTGSVLPAALAHGLMNVLASSPLGSAFFGIGPLIYLLWILLAYALFRYWPVEPEYSGATNAVIGL